MHRQLEVLRFLWSVTLEWNHTNVHNRKNYSVCRFFHSETTYLSVKLALWENICSLIVEKNLTSVLNATNLPVKLELWSGGEKADMCTKCNKLFSRAGNLRTYLLTHSGEKAHKCGQCEKSFNQARDLKRHLLTQSGEKPHTCTECNTDSVKLKVWSNINSLTLAKSLTSVRNATNHSVKLELWGAICWLILFWIGWLMLVGDFNWR